MSYFKKNFDNFQTYFEYRNHKDNIPTIFIHGVGLDSSMWEPQKKIFIKNSVIFYDILNHGKSKKGYKKLSLEKFSNQLNRLVNFINCKKFNIVGFSIGALIAQHYTSVHFKKINKLILIGSVYNRSKSQLNKVKNRFINASNGDSITADSINRWFNKSYLKSNPKVYKKFYTLLEKNKSSNFLPAYKVFTENDNRFLDFSNFKMPTLIMTGEKEIGSTPKMSIGISRKIDNSKLFIIKNAKHGVTIEKANTINKKILDFLK